MLDERWSEDVETIGDALRKLLMTESSMERVRLAEGMPDGRDPELARQLEDFGLVGLEADAPLFARIAFELGRALSATPYVDTIPMLALTGRSNVALAFDGFAPSGVGQVAVRRLDGIYVEDVSGEPRRTTAGDSLVAPRSPDGGERIGDAALGDRLERYGALISAARLVGAGQALLEYGAAYAREREQFGKVIGSYQGVAHRLSRSAGDLDAAELLVRKAAFSALDAAGGDGVPAPAFALMVRAKAIEAARAAATNVHQVFGGNGFAMEYDVQLYSRRIRSWSMRSPRSGSDLATLARLMLTPSARNEVVGLWHYARGVELPRWASEADRLD